VLELATKVDYYASIKLQCSLFWFRKGSSEEEGVDVGCVVAQELAWSLQLLSFLLEVRVLFRGDFDLEHLQDF